MAKRTIDQAGPAASGGDPKKGTGVKDDKKEKETKILTWNMQGRRRGDTGDDKWKILFDYIVQNDIDIACIQEAGNINPPKDGAFPEVTIELEQNKKEDNGKGINWIIHSGVADINTDSQEEAKYFIHHWGKITEEEKEMRRVNIMCLVKEALADSPIDWEAPAPDKLRPFIGIMLKGKSVKINSTALNYIYSFHAPSSDGAAGTAYSMLKGIQEERQGRWMVCGDFNCQPDDLKAYKRKSDGESFEGLVDKVKKQNGGKNKSQWNVLLAVGQKTHDQGGKLDYGATNIDCNKDGYEYSVQVDKNNGKLGQYSDHRAVLYTFPV